MDEESVGIFGVLLIVTALVMSQTLHPKHYATPRLPDVSWQDVVSVFACGQSASENCYLAMSQ